MMAQLRCDYRRYRATGHSIASLLFCRGYQAVVSYRLRRWLWSKRIPFVHVIVGYLTEIITGVEIPVTVSAGGGLLIYHGGPVLIVDSARLGENVSIRPGVVIGGDFAGKGGPELGAGTEIGVGAKVIGAVSLGEKCRVGANAVVTRSFPANSVLVGVPARALERGK